MEAWATSSCPSLGSGNQFQVWDKHVKLNIGKWGEIFKADAPRLNVRK